MDWLKTGSTASEELRGRVARTTSHVGLGAVLPDIPWEAVCSYLPRSFQEAVAGYAVGELKAKKRVSVQRVPRSF